jgi:Flp pilus assembly protein TadD
MAHFLGQRFDKAISTLLLAIEEDPSYPQPYRYLAASYAHLGQLGQARAVIERLRAAAPLVVPDTSYLRNPEHRQLYLSGVLLAIGHKASVLSAYTGS